MIGVSITVLASREQTGSHEVTLQEGPEGGGAMLEIAGQGASATAMFRKLDQEIPPGPPDLPKVVGILQQHGVSVAA